MAKRASVKGMGADIFNIGEASTATSGNHESMISQNQQDRWPKTTFYLPNDLQRRLTKRWFEMKEKNRGVTKSEIVRQALEQYLGQDG